MKFDGKKMQIVMLRKCMDFDDVAKAAGMRTCNLYRIIRTGKCKVSTAGKIAKALEVDPLELVEL